MGKPASMRRVELRKDIMDDINAAKLPPYVVEEILEKIIAQVRENVEMQYRGDMAEWIQAQKKEDEDVRNPE